MGDSTIVALGKSAEATQVAGLRAADNDGVYRGEMDIDAVLQGLDEGAARSARLGDVRDLGKVLIDLVLFCQKFLDDAICLWIGGRPWVGRGEWQERVDLSCLTATGAAALLAVSEVSNGCCFGAGLLGSHGEGMIGRKTTSSSRNDIVSCT